MIKLIPIEMKENRKHYATEAYRTYEYNEAPMKSEISKETKNNTKLHLMEKNMWIDDALYAIFYDVYYKLNTHD